MKNKLPYEATGNAIKDMRNQQQPKAKEMIVLLEHLHPHLKYLMIMLHRYVADEFGRKPRNGTYGTVTQTFKNDRKLV
jgi:hypothetical protein